MFDRYVIYDGQKYNIKKTRDSCHPTRSLRAQPRSQLKCLCPCAACVCLNLTHTPTPPHPAPTPGAPGARRSPGHDVVCAHDDESDNKRAPRSRAPHVSHLSSARAPCPVHELHLRKKQPHHGTTEAREGEKEQERPKDVRS